MPRGRTTVPVITNLHKECGEENERLAKSLLSISDMRAKKYDWVITVSCYSAMHFIYTKLSTPNILSNNTDFINEILNSFTGTKQTELYKNYSWLRDKSVDVRYLPRIAKDSRNQKVLGEKAIETLEEIKRLLGV